MTRKQFNWLKNNQHIKVCWFEIYKGKEPKSFHHLHTWKIDMQIVGERFYFAGIYHTFNGRTFDEHYAKYDVHYKNIRVIRYKKDTLGEMYK